MKAKVVTNALNRAHQYVVVGSDGPFWGPLELTLDQARAIRAALNEHEQIKSASAAGDTWTGVKESVTV